MISSYFNLIVSATRKQLITIIYKYAHPGFFIQEDINDDMLRGYLMKTLLNRELTGLNIYDTIQKVIVEEEALKEEERAVEEFRKNYRNNKSKQGT